jgi:hypothetical protein
MAGRIPIYRRVGDVFMRVQDRGKNSAVFAANHM